jgi:hypothetical protein
MSDELNKLPVSSVPVNEQSTQVDMLQGRPVIQKNGPTMSVVSSLDLRDQSSGNSQPGGIPTVVLAKPTTVAAQ